MSHSKRSKFTKFELRKSGGFPAEPVDPEEGLHQREVFSQNRKNKEELLRSVWSECLLGDMADERRVKFENAFRGLNKFQLECLDLFLADRSTRGFDFTGVVAERLSDLYQREISASMVKSTLQESKAIILRALFKEDMEFILSQWKFQQRMKQFLEI